MQRHVTPVHLPTGAIAIAGVTIVLGVGGRRVWSWRVVLLVRARLGVHVPSVKMNDLRMHF